MDCPECLIATDFHEYRLFNPLCKFCGARILQVLGTLDTSAYEIKRRRVAMLDEWERFGHSRMEIRDLAKGALALPTRAQAAADPPKKRRRKFSSAAALTGG